MAFKHDDWVLQQISRCGPHLGGLPAMNRERNEENRHGTDPA